MRVATLTPSAAAMGRDTSSMPAVQASAVLCCPTAAQRPSQLGQDAIAHLLQLLQHALDGTALQRRQPSQLRTQLGAISSEGLGFGH